MMTPNASFKPTVSPEESEQLFPTEKAQIAPPDTLNMDAPGPEYAQPAQPLTPDETSVSDGSGKTSRKEPEMPQDAAKTGLSPTASPAKQPPTVNESLVLIHSEDQTDSSISSDSESDPGTTKQRREKHIKRWTKKARKAKRAAMQIAKGIFIRETGIIYVSNDHWNECKIVADNCHLYVASTVLGMDSSMRVEDMRAKGHRLPPRFRISNTLLNEEMERFAGVPSMNQDHVVPYRSIIRHEAKYRERLQELEAQFNKMSQEEPSHSTVQHGSESHYPIPDRLCYSVNSYVIASGTKAGSKTGLDDMEKTKILLDGFRTLIHFFDTDLRELVQDYYRIQSNTIEKLPFAHLWHLFTPGQEICTKQPRHQIHRVLQVTGGRKCLHRTGKKKIHQKTTSDLVIDCFHLEFDGTEFNPVATVLRIKPYNGSRIVTSLPVYPLALAKPIVTGDVVENVADILTIRGKKYEELSKPSHCRYKGLSVCEGNFDTPEEVSEAQVDV